MKVRSFLLLDRYTYTSAATPARLPLICCPPAGCSDLCTSARLREIGRSKRGQLSISDSNHHVTEAIGDMYGDDDYSKSDSRPLSFITSPTPESHESKLFVASPLNQTMEAGNTYFDDSDKPRAKPSPHTNGNKGKKAQISSAMLPSPRSPSSNPGDLSPTFSMRDRRSSDTANAQFPLNNVDYESDPAAVAQELSNLQALRRMSMDVGNTSDPDLPSFQSASPMPSIAPTGDDDEDDPSRLFWVPARVHPELAPMEFKTFLENRVQSIKRRSGEQQTLSLDGIQRSGSGSSLRRKKSMLCRQIDNDGGRGAVGYKDGADQLERRKSLETNKMAELKISDLKELDANRQTQTGEVIDEDKPILPQAPGVGLRRSRHTTYRRGSLRKEGRGSRKTGIFRGADTDGEESPFSPNSPPIDSLIGNPLTRVQSEPAITENFSRPNRNARRLQSTSQTSYHTGAVEDKADDTGKSDISMINTGSETPALSPGSVPKSSTVSRNDAPVPRIIETPPAEEVPEPPLARQPPHLLDRSSSQGPVRTPQPAQISPEPPARSNKRPTMERQNSGAQLTSKTAPPLKDMASQPSPLPGNHARTDALTINPTSEERKPEKKSKKDKDESEVSAPRKTSWGWFKGSDEKEKRKKEEDQKRGKSKVSVDNARLDVLQSTLDTAAPRGRERGRESLLMERDNSDYKLQDERKKESSRKSSDSKKEKDGLFSSLFGGGKKKSDRDSGGKKSSSLRTLSPDPPPRQLKPDIDYNWTRFSILEERAIYRMAHIKLANPRRALYSQVLLSNFMYSYLAKVQQMHPQMQIPQSAMQKKQEADRKAKELEQQRQQQQQQEGGEQYRYDYHQGITQYAEPTHDAQAEGVDYVDDSQIYNYDHPQSAPGQSSNRRPQSRASQHTQQENGYGDQSQYDRNGQDYYQQQPKRKDDNDDDNDEMW
ncbi:hypothetical protein MBM_06374 [Drepanopeziza brunnea f. sp. 'multigermtubi' MB_m1]|uniref:Protein Zds1 C-terminal domain-containing protein n=1 Tax=Marssonina brunnea f. sp. multigermtubi (strain MB_m1) TaxID=1072389 RepID=K1X397_MARBU|nr:uncharacterized protein MBM_06374 [Drepanopeziza brunnea f. sp. 'multigermtubi' MB_m1]EKD15158.1 hypothetical protein MBM_06374 [Drepanopeziza brunnea f. sp. 'multigermtubi' MB_m1]